jgi:hypothetical protein
MSKKSCFCVLAAALVVVGLGIDLLATGKKPQPQPEPTYTAYVFDDAQYMVRSDGRGLYVDYTYDEKAAEDCVRVWDTIMLRTVHNSDVCNGQLSYWSNNPLSLPTHRFLTLDFGDSTPGDLDGNGVAEPIEKAPARIGFSRVQGGLAQAGILVLRVNPDGTTTQDTAWSVNYYNLAHAETDGSGTTLFYLEPGEATADLYEVVGVVNPNNRRVKETYVLVGTFDLPFRIQIATQQ